MNAVIRIVTDYGEHTPTPQQRQIFEAAKLRKDGQPDMRTAAGKVARQMIDSVLLQSKPEFIKD